jgi:protein phosphatase
LITEMIRKGGMSPADAALHPLSHTLTNCIGTQEHLEIDFKLQTVMTGDRYIFCSDGLSSMVSPKDLCRAGFEADAPDTAVKEMIQLALDGGGTDNITAVSLFVK